MLFTAENHGVDFQPMKIPVGRIRWEEELKVVDCSSLNSLFL